LFRRNRAVEGNGGNVLLHIKNAWRAKEVECGINFLSRSGFKLSVKIVVCILKSVRGQQRVVCTGKMLMTKL